MSRRDERESYTYRKRRYRLRRRLEQHPELARCWLCGEPINMSLHPLDDLAFSLDHIVPISAGGSIDAEVRPAHRVCNSSRGDGKKSQVKMSRPVWA